MNRRVLWILAAAVALAVLLVWVLFGPTGAVTTRDDVAEGDALPTPTPAPEQRVLLLFPGSDGLLHPELRNVPLPAEVYERTRMVVLELLAGPTGDLHPVVPWDAELSAVFVDHEGTAFIDITAPPEPLEGAQIELMLAYGLVDTILLNCPELHAVQILIGGHEIPTLTGHLDFSRPLVLNKKFIAS